MDLIAVYDTKEKIERKTTPDLLAELLLEYVPQSNSWVSEPDEDDPMGERWTPQWSSITEALAGIEGFLDSDAARRMAVDGFSADELIAELRLFSDELREASRHATRFYVCIY